MSRIEEIRKQVVLRRGNVPVESRESGLLCDLAELLAHIDAQAAQIEKLRAALEYIGNRSASPWVQEACQSALAATADGNTPAPHAPGKE